jgi:hypothetical protein
MRHTQAASGSLSLNLSLSLPLIERQLPVPAQRASGRAHHRGGRADVSPGRSGFGAAAAPGTGPGRARAQARGLSG